LNGANEVAARSRPNQAGYLMTFSYRERNVEPISPRNGVSPSPTALAFLSLFSNQAAETITTPHIDSRSLGHYYGLLSHRLCFKVHRPCSLRVVAASPAVLLANAKEAGID
jgi:hypothetical protein